MDGKSLKPHEITISYCRKIGDILADIHMIDFSSLSLVNDNSNNTELTACNFYLQQGKEINSEWVNFLLEVIDDHFH